MKKRRVTCIFMAVFLAISTTVAFADTISDKKKELDNVNKNIENAKSEISKVKSEQDDLVSQIAKIELDLKEKEEQLAEIEESLSAIQESIQLTEKELKEAIEKAELHKELMDERLCAMYMTTGTSNAELIEIMLDSKNITDFLDRVAMIREIMSLDREIFDEMQSIKEEIEEQKDSLEMQKEIEEGTKQFIVSQKVLIEEKHKEKETLFGELKKQREKMENDLGELERTSKNLESTIKRLVAEREAQERREREASREVSRGGSREDSREDSNGNNSNDGTQLKISGGSSAVVSLALKQEGKPYRWGAEGPYAFDCSGLVCYVYRQIGVHGIPHNAAQQSVMGKGTRINSKGALKPGDLVFFAKGGRVNHVGIYIGNGSFVHAESSRTGVVIGNLNRGSYSRRFVGGRRIIN